MAKYCSLFLQKSSIVDVLLPSGYTSGKCCIWGLYKGAKRPQRNPNFASEIVVNDLILVSSTFLRKAKSHYDNRRFNHQRDEKNEEHLIFNFSLFLRLNFIIWIQGSSSYANDEVVFPSYEMLNKLKNV